MTPLSDITGALGGYLRSFRRDVNDVRATERVFLVYRLADKRLLVRLKFNETAGINLAEDLSAKTAWSLAERKFYERQQPSSRTSDK